MANSLNILTLQVQKYFFIISLFLIQSTVSLKANTCDKPEVIVTIKPLASIAQSIMTGVTKPIILLKNLTSPHEGSLTPYQIYNISKADVIFWIGRNLESYLEKPIKNLSKSSVNISFIKEKNILLLLLRKPYCFHKNYPKKINNKYNLKYFTNKKINLNKNIHKQILIDPHIWLYPDNSQKIALKIAEILSQVDPNNKNIYESNAQNFINSINKICKKIKENLNLTNNKSFLTMHDGYQYFEKAFHLNGYKNIFLNNHHTLGNSIKNLKKIIHNMHKLKPSCIIAEKNEVRNFPILVSRILKTRLIWSKSINHDYKKILENIGKSFINCFQKKNTTII